MHRRSSGSPVEDDAEDSLVSRASTEDSHGVTIYDTPDKIRSQIARTGHSFDLRRENTAATPRSRNSSAWRNPPSQTPNDDTKSAAMMPLASQRLSMESSPEAQRFRQSRLRSPWSCSLLTLFATLLATIALCGILHSFATRQVGADGCDVPVMSPTFIKMLGFDTEHTRFASKYKLYLYREEGVDPYTQENIGVRTLRKWFPSASDGNADDIFLYSLTGCLFSFFPEMPAATDKCDPWPRRLRDTTSKWYDMTRSGTRPELAAWTFS